MFKQNVHKSLTNIKILAQILLNISKYSHHKYLFFQLYKHI